MSAAGYWPSSHCRSSFRATCAFADRVRSAIAFYRPTVIYKPEYLADFVALRESHAAHDKHFRDSLKSSFAFERLSSVAASMTFSDDHHTFIVNIADKCIAFTGHTDGDEYEDSLLEILTVFRCVFGHLRRRLGCESQYNDRTGGQ
jgi:hypothetical protein